MYKQYISIGFTIDALEVYFLPTYLGDLRLPLKCIVPERREKESSEMCF